MTDPRFVHLRLHSEYSITDGIVRLDDAVARAIADGQPAMALTDLANAFGLVKFYNACRGKGVKPVAGADVWIANETETDRPFRLLLLVRSHRGYLQLCELLSRAYLAEGRRDRAEIKRAWFDEVGCDGLIALSGAKDGDVGDALLAGNRDLAAARARAWSAQFPQAFYLEVQRAGHPQQEQLVSSTADLGADLELPLVATHPIQFLDADDFKAHEARVCIAEGYVLGDRRRPKTFTEQQYFKTQAEMAELFADLPEALENTLEIAKRCNLTLTPGQELPAPVPHPRRHLPGPAPHQRGQGRPGEAPGTAVPGPGGAAAAAPGVRRAPGNRDQDHRADGLPRLLPDRGRLHQLGEAQRRPRGPGPGFRRRLPGGLQPGHHRPGPAAVRPAVSSASSTPERVSMPDFDIDFCQDNRWRVIEYVRHKYGVDAVSQIATFGTMSSKAVIRDVGRVLDLPYNFCDSLSKLIPVEANKPVSLAQALEMEPQLKEKMEEEEEVAELFELAMKLEDLTRNVGMHAGGVLIAPGKLTDFCPPLRPARLRLGGQPVRQGRRGKSRPGEIRLPRPAQPDHYRAGPWSTWNGSPGEKLDLLSLPFTDPAAYQILKDANTTAIFQVESEGHEEAAEEAGPRPLRRHHRRAGLVPSRPPGLGHGGRLHPAQKGPAEDRLFPPGPEGAAWTPTYGVIVYQEQVMQISQIIGGYTLGGADMLRRAMGKKKAEEMAKHRETIAEGAKKKGYDPALAEQAVRPHDQVRGVRLSTSPTPPPTPWSPTTPPGSRPTTARPSWRPTMSSDMDNTDTVKIFYEDTVKNGIKVLRGAGREPLRLPLRAAGGRQDHPLRPWGRLKGTGQQAVECILAARAGSAVPSRTSSTSACGWTSAW